MDEILWCDHSNETFLAERLNSTVYSTRFFKWLFLAPFPGLYASLFPRTPSKSECPLSDSESLASKKHKAVTLANHKRSRQSNEPTRIRNKYMQPVKSEEKTRLIDWLIKWREFSSQSKTIRQSNEPIRIGQKIHAAGEKPKPLQNY